MTTLTMPQIAQVASRQWQGNDLVTAVAVAMAESSGRTDAFHTNTNGSKDYGLWQINDIHSGGRPPANWADPAANAALAHGVWASSGWSAWSTYKSGSYLAFRLQAAQAVQSAPRSPLDVIGDAVTGAGDAAGSAADTAAQGVRLAAAAGEWVSDPRSWLRVVYVAAGLALIVGGLVVVAGGRPAALKRVL